jgi:hypothetical protein
LLLPLSVIESSSHVGLCCAEEIYNKSPPSTYANEYRLSPARTSRPPR